MTTPRAPDAYRFYARRRLLAKKRYIVCYTGREQNSYLFWRFARYEYQRAIDRHDLSFLIYLAKYEDWIRYEL